MDLQLTTLGVCTCRFLSSDLAGVDRSKTPWVVVVGHKPVFPSSDASTMSAVQTLLQTQKVWSSKITKNKSSSGSDGDCTTL
jgi:hypothetical protein